MSASPLTEAEARRLLERLARFPHVALAVSGGPDSLALMHLAARSSAEQGGTPVLSVLTVDHGLRPGSRDEALMVERMARGLGLSHAILTWQEEGRGSRNVQERARTARYDLMAAHCHAHDIPAIVTAHHLDDQAETFLMRLKRGSGLDGLAAIPEEGAWAGVVILRPLLDVPKARLVATLADAAIAYVSDPSNADHRFERARMRSSSDALAKLGLTPEALALSARRLRRAREAIDRAAEDFLVRHSDTSEAGYALIDRQALGSAPHEIALRALSRLIRAVGGGEAPSQLAKLEAMFDALHESPESAHTLGGCRIEPIAEQFGIFREIRKQGLPVLDLKPGERQLWDNRFKIELGRDEPAPITVRALGNLGFKDLRERLPYAASLPLLAGRALPSCWRGEALIGIPSLGVSLSSETGRVDCRASFIGWRTLRAGNADSP
jgi:tRNA(Ile)-lysidine synthase